MHGLGIIQPRYFLTRCISRMNLIRLKIARQTARNEMMIVYDESRYRESRKKKKKK